MQSLFREKLYIFIGKMHLFIKQRNKVNLLGIKPTNVYLKRYMITMKPKIDYYHETIKNYQASNQSRDSVS